MRHPFTRSKWLFFYGIMGLMLFGRKDTKMLLRVCGDPLQKWHERMMGRCCTNCSSSTHPTLVFHLLSCCHENFFIYYFFFHWLFWPCGCLEVNLCFALAFCSMFLSWMFEMSLPPWSYRPIPPRLSVRLSVFHVSSITFWFSHFLKYSFYPPPSPSSLLSLLFLMLVMSALACYGVTNHPLRNLHAIQTQSAHTKMLHHDWLLPTTTAPSSAPPVCPPIGLLRSAPPCPALIGGYFRVPSL